MKMQLNWIRAQQVGLNRKPGQAANIKSRLFVVPLNPNP